MVQVWQKLPNVSREGRLFEAEIPGSRFSVSSTVVGLPQRYELDEGYVDNDFCRCLFYHSAEGGNEATENSNDFNGYGYVEVYMKKSGRCPEKPDFVYVASTPHDYLELAIFLATLGGVRRQRSEESDY